MDYKKNDIVRLTIEDIGTEGEGIGKIDGFTLFVKDAVVGDEIFPMKSSWRLRTARRVPICLASAVLRSRW